ncbi:MAG: helicase [Deltaproteobacteria bacterium]|nr:helicase [Deltaproteobacteria bacterium]
MHQHIHQEILQKMNIDALNPMQEESFVHISSDSDVILLSPTGTGKTLAFLLPLIEKIQSKQEVQILILVPARELAIQIEQVIRKMGAGFKVNAVYGGHSHSKDKINLQHPPAILVGTPGRVASHVRKGTFDVDMVSYLVLDEFDKALEIGFEKEMKEIIQSLPNVQQRILTSATQELKIPSFVSLKNPTRINYLSDSNDHLQIRRIVSPTKDKLSTLYKTLCGIGDQSGIIFCNFKDSIERVSDFLRGHHISHACFHGGMEQKDRERSLIMFRNGTHRILLATDLAARGIDVPEIGFVLHYHLPNHEHEFIHRNGRTARMCKGGTAYILHWVSDTVPDFVRHAPQKELNNHNPPPQTKWNTLFISGGRKNKISKGDIAGMFIKQGKIDPDQIGLIEIKQDCTFVAVHKDVASMIVHTLNNRRIKKKKVRIYLI